MRYLLVALVIPALVACGAYRFPGGPSAGTGTVNGQVLATPCFPVEQVGKPCPGRPVANLVIRFSGQNGAAASTTTKSDGTYSVQLAPGTWSVSFKTYQRVISGPSTINVTSGVTVTANYVIDSGIRAPVPAPTD